MSGGPFVRDVDSAGFEADVIERSRSVPVVVDFWATWCGPCRVLGPVLEKEIAALGGRVELAKIDTDKSPDLAGRFGIQGIPAVKAFRDGQVVDEFVGALPAGQIRAFLAKLAPSEAALTLQRALAALNEGRAQEAADLFTQVTASDDYKNAALLGLAEAKLDLGAVDDVPALLAQIDPRSDAADAIPAIERRVALHADAKAYGGEAAAAAAVAANPKDLDARWALASAQAARGAYAEALENFLAIVARNRKFKDDGARLAMLALFDKLGSGHQLTQDFRRQLQIVL